MADILTLLDVVNRTNPPEPWAEGDNIPWDEPTFSERMLAEHLSQEHDLASRRAETIDAQVNWIHEAILGGRPTRVLDLACGPGLYTTRLAKLGHECVGIDFAPAAVAHANKTAEEAGLACRHIQADVRTAEFGEGFGLVMMIYGQFNVFRRSQAASHLSRAHAALDEGGAILLEPQTSETVRGEGTQSSSWSTAERGLFSDRPHLVLQEWFWNEAAQTSTERWHIVDAATGRVARYAMSDVAYTDQELVSMLEEAGFERAEFFTSLTGGADGPDPHNCVVVARK